MARTERKMRAWLPRLHGASPRPTSRSEQDLARRDLTVNATALPAQRWGRRPLTSHRPPRWPTLPRPARPARQGAAPRDRRLPRRPGAHPARGALRGTLRRLQRRPRNHGADARDGRRRRGRCAGGRARVAGAVARPDGNTPSRMFEVLRECGALAVLLPELDGGTQTTMAVIDASASPAGLAGGALRLPHAQRETSSSCSRCATAGACRWTSANWPRWWRASMATSTAATRAGRHGLVRLLERCDAFRKPALRRGAAGLRMLCAAGPAPAMRPTRSASACSPCWRRQRPWPPMWWPKPPSSPAPPARRSARRSTRPGSKPSRRHCPPGHDFWHFPEQTRPIASTG